ncbi:DUF2637 domain-containing protein [Streptomyces scopuliridis]|uniref:DUF2637 domain-containing protein n=1 Tax=Streptomyces scopuliridis TaxID=452529 RepID=UPI00369B9521
MRGRLARIKLDPILIQAVIAAGLSFDHIREVAEAAGQGGWKAWAYPVSVDLLLVAAWRKMRSEKRSVLGWSWFLVALVASLGANVATAGLLDMDALPVGLKVVVGGWPAVAFLGGTLLVHGRKVEGEKSEVVKIEPAPLVVPQLPLVEPDTASAIRTTQAVAEALGVKPATVRGWASGATPKVKHHGYDEKGRTLVDLFECRALVVAAK